MGVEQIEYLGACRQMGVEGLQSEQNGRDVVAAVGGGELDLSNGGLSKRKLLLSDGSHANVSNVGVKRPLKWQHGA